MEELKWLMLEVLKCLHKESLPKEDMYENSSKPFSPNRWRLFVRENLFDKGSRSCLESVAKDANLKIDTKLLKGFLVIY